MRVNPINMTVGECVLNYSQPFLSRYSNLALVMDWRNSTNSILFAATLFLSGSHGLGPGWPCEPREDSNTPSCDPAKLAKSKSPYWSPSAGFFGSPLADFYLPDGVRPAVKNCLAQQTNSLCEIGITPAIVYISLAANTLKVICLYGTLFCVGRASKPLVTTGDVIESFISKPDPHLNSRCMTSIFEVRKNPNFWAAQRLPLESVPKRRRWVRSPSLVTWFSLLVPATCGIGSVIVLYETKQLNETISLGFGSTSTSELVWWGVPWNLKHGLVGSVLLANTPQTILSYIYTAYNAVLTSMLSQSELLRYSSKPRGLRVTQPAEGQRSTYWLQQPYRYSLTLIGMWILLHWLVSESFFLVRVKVYMPDGQEAPSQLISTVGYSSLAIVVSLAIMASCFLGS